MKDYIEILIQCLEARESKRLLEEEKLAEKLETMWTKLSNHEKKMLGRLLKFVQVDD